MLRRLVLFCIGFFLGILPGCMRHAVTAAPPQSETAYRITRADGAKLIVAYGAPKTLTDLQHDFCEHQTCMVELVRLKTAPLPHP